MTIDRPDSRPSLSRRLWTVARRAVVATKWLVLGAGTGLLALVGAIALLLVIVLSAVGIGLVLLAPTLDLIRWIADLERRRLAALGQPIAAPYGPVPERWQEAWQSLRHDTATRRDLGWLGIHATVGLVLGLLLLELLSNAVQELTTPLWWRLLDPGTASMVGGFVPVESWADARWAVGTGLAWAIVWFATAPWLLRAQNASGSRLLTPHPEVDLSARVAQLTASRAAALDAHAVELRRIERALHDGAQNRLVTVAVLTGAARQALSRDPATAGPLIDRVQESAETALAELRSVVRSILPPVLESEGLSGALSALAAQCPVPTSVDPPAMSRCPMAIEAIAYYAVAEALTNVARHSGASRAQVRIEQEGGLLRVQVSDDGGGGATIGSGLAGIRDRVRAHDGTMRLHSPAGGPTVLEVALPCE